MKTRLRLALPPLARIAPESMMAFALFDRADRLLRSGELPLSQLSQVVPVDNVWAILHPDDAIVATITLPPLSAKRLDDAVQSSVEPMALSNLADLCIAHGPRAADGTMQVTWTESQALLEAWRQLSDAGLKISAIVPFALAIGANDPHPNQTLGLPVDERWHAPLPRWSLAKPEWRPASHTHRWRASALWAGAAVLVWLLGLQIYAGQLRNEVTTLRASTEHAIREAFPGIPVIIDPLRQARNQLDMLRLAGGSAGADDFMPLALGASRVLDFADGHVSALHYEEGKLTLVLAEGYAPPTNEAGLHQTAALHSLTLAKDDNAAHTWHFRLADVQADREAR
jgi:general secretion pathway protein L